MGRLDGQLACCLEEGDPRAGLGPPPRGLHRAGGTVRQRRGAGRGQYPRAGPRRATAAQLDEPRQVAPSARGDSHQRMTPEGETRPTTKEVPHGEGEIRALARRGLALAALCLAALVISLDTTIVNVTLPSLVRELHATTTNLQWVVDAYSLVFAALILAAGSLSDRVGRKGILLAGLGVFAAGSLAGALVNTPAELIAARALMGIGAAGIFPSTLSIIANVFSERRERARAIGLWGATT